MNRTRTVALAAHERCTAELVRWADENRERLGGCRLILAGTGGLLEEARRLKLEPRTLGADAGLAASVAEGRFDALVLFWAPGEPPPRAGDVAALLASCEVYNIPVARDRAAADLLFLSRGWSGAGVTLH